MVGASATGTSSMEGALRSAAISSTEVADILAFVHITYFMLHFFLAEFLEKKQYYMESSGKFAK